MNKIKNIFELVIVEEKKTFLNSFTYGRIFGVFFLLLSIPTFIILPFLDQNHFFWFFLYFWILVSFFIISFLIMNLKYNLKFDYIIIGKLFLDRNKFEFSYDGFKEVIDLNKNQIVFYYNSIRNKGFHFLKRDFPRNGISEFVINNKTSVKVLISKERELQELKLLFRIWYSEKNNFSEYTRTNEKYRLIELENRFDWKQLQEIKLKSKI